jgi:hypothetical protein
MRSILAISRWPKMLVCLAGLACAAMCARAGAQIKVDCTGKTSGAYTTISAALKSAPVAGATIVITGPCTEKVSISGLYNLSLGAAPGKTVKLTGSLSVSNAANLYLYGLKVTNSSGAGISITSANGVTLDDCTSNDNGTDGLFVSQTSDVTALGTSTFSGNKRYGMNLNGHAHVSLAVWSGGSTTISNNTDAGVWITEGSLLDGTGPLSIESNGIDGTSTAPAVHGYGVEMYGASIVQFGDCAGSTTILDNVSGGFSVEENSELSLWNCDTGHKHLIESNGPVGITLGLGSEATISYEVQISGHKGPAVAVTSHSVLYAAGPDVFSHNGASDISKGAGIAVSGNSHAFLQGGQIASTPGPAVLAQLGSTVNLSQMTFTANVGGVIECDGSSYMSTDVTHANAQCQTPSTAPAPAMQTAPHSPPDTTAIRNRQAQYRRLASDLADVDHHQPRGQP